EAVGLPRLTRKTPSPGALPRQGATSAAFWDGGVAAPHAPTGHARRRVRKRLRDGVIRDIERQNRKKENIRLLGEQILLTEQLEAEREKMVLAKGSQET
uniref:PET117 cytochrome c oxidase chaperone n=1 Tax=Ovis aries TaxID=9940 RepID=A0AC11CDZ0_SHEEP